MSWPVCSVNAWPSLILDNAVASSPTVRSGRLLLGSPPEIPIPGIGQSF